MILKIYFNDKPVFLTNELTAELEGYRHHPDTIYIDEVSTQAIKSLLHEIEKPDFHAGILLGDDIETLQKKFWKHFDVIHAGGGVVENEESDILMIFRRGKWDLPKGKQDEGETIETCALREVQEETGLHQVTLQQKLPTTYHTYHQFGKHILKESHWFIMKGIKNEPLIPQTEEDILQIEWVPASQIDQKLSNTFPSIVDVLSNYKTLK